MKSGIVQNSVLKYMYNFLQDQIGV